ncbi:hypothetical protein Y015_00495 [Chlamydia muridarum str. Nigg CM972]|nr:hypothetical protein TAC_00495 [Chlamydia muridarum str. Nigg3 CMUT3-5]AHH23415.1 hypothetical protein Y015_00495 [Chlamydia muridarum str. Nigg CM972]
MEKKKSSPYCQEEDFAAGMTKRLKRAFMLKEPFCLL